MTTVMVTEIIREAAWVILKVSGPLLLVALGVGVLVSLFQALTQVQEMTLTFVPKMIAIFLCLIMLIPFMISTLTAFAHELFAYIPQLGGG